MIATPGGILAWAVTGISLEERDCKFTLIFLPKTVLNKSSNLSRYHVEKFAVSTVYLPAYTLQSSDIGLAHQI